MNDPLVGVTLSSFQNNNFNAFLTQLRDAPTVRVIDTPFGQVYPPLIDKSAPCWQENPDFAVVWAHPQAAVPAFQAALVQDDVSRDDIFQQVDEFASLLQNLNDRVPIVFVPIWTAPAFTRGLGLLDLKEEFGISRLLMEMNLRLCSHLSKVPGVYPLNPVDWIQAAGTRAYVPKLWYMAKVPFANEVFRAAAAEVKAALRAVLGQTKKLVIVDLDDTLWEGVVGETGWEGLVLGGHHPNGEALVDFQSSLKSLTRRGVILAIASKNDESVALQAIDRHPEMVLRRQDFVTWRINWSDKAENVVQIANELNLGLQSVVFIDDNPVERARVRDALPEVLVPEWPEEKTAYPKAFAELTCFDAATWSEEDRQRGQMYLMERKRSAARKSVSSLEEWLEQLGTKVRIERLNAATLSRATQLLNKTNQMNLSTRRMTASEFIAWSQEPRRSVWTFTVSDQFGTHGMTGLLSVEGDTSNVRIIDFVLSCRVFGRHLEQLMLATAVDYARSEGVSSLKARYVETPKNKPCLEFFRGSGLDHNGSGNSFSWATANRYPTPDYIEVDVIK